MDILKIFEVITIVVTLVIMDVVCKRNPEKSKDVVADAFCWSFVGFVPFAFLETLAAFGIELFGTSFEIPWAFTPLGFLSILSWMFLMRLLGRETWLNKIFRDKSADKQQNAEKQDAKQLV